VSVESASAQTGLPVTPKRLYLARRKPSLTREQFIRRWREHGKLAMSFMARQNWENVTAYIHFDPVSEATGVAGASDDYDAIGWIRFKDVAARKRHIEFAEARAVLEPDEDAFFTERVNRTGMVTWELPLRDGPSSGVTKFCFLKRKHELSSAAFDDYWRHTHAPLVMRTMPAMQRYVQNYPLPPEKGAAWGLGCDGVEESWFSSLDDVKRAHTETVTRAIEQDRSRFVRECVVVIAQQTVLYPD
jgi:uncharacterized protein (TIGR02118 family)